MSGPGRKRLPTNLKVLRGTDQPCRMNPAEVKPDSDQLEPPLELSAMARVHWDDISKKLAKAGLLTNLDVTALTMYCEAYATWADATENIRKFGTIIKTPKTGYPMPSPYLQVANKAFEQMKSLLTEFGMTPAARAKVPANLDKPKANPFAKNARRPK